MFWISPQKQEHCGIITQPSVGGGGRDIGFELIPDDLIAGVRKPVKTDWVLGVAMLGGEIAFAWSGTAADQILNYEPGVASGSSVFRHWLTQES